MIAILVIAGLIGLTFAFALWLSMRSSMPKVIFDREPDLPTAFGCNMAWMAVKTENAAALAKVLGLEEKCSANWNSGLGTVYDGELGETRVFVSPPVYGWTFVIGLPLPHPVGKTFVDKLTPLMLRLSGDYSELHYYATYPLIDFFAWVRVVDGRLVRAFAVGDEGIVWNKGRVSKQERALGLKLFDLRGVNGRKGDAGGEIVLYPTEEHVLRIARGWSVDPSVIEQYDAMPGLGIVAVAPASWRAQRAKTKKRRRTPRHKKSAA